MTRDGSESLDDLGDLREWLQPVPGPTASEAAAGRRLLLTRLAEQPSPAAGWRGLLLKPAGLLAGALLFGAFALGGAGAAGVPVQSPVQDVLQAVGLQKAGNSDVAPPGLNKNDKPAAGASQQSAGDHGRSVSDAVHEAIDGADPGPDRGDAVRDAACRAAQDRSTLPQPAQDHGTPEAKESHACAEGSPANTTNVSGTPTPTPKPGNRPQPTPRGRGAGSAAESTPRGQGQNDKTPRPPTPTPTPPQP